MMKKLILATALLLWPGLAAAQTQQQSFGQYIQTLPLAGSPLTGQEQLYVLQGGVSKKALASSFIGTTSVSNNDGTLIISPNTGAVVASCTAASASQLGCVKPDGTIALISGGVLTVAKATNSAYGVVQPDGTIAIISGGLLTVAQASASNFGVVEGDNATLTISGGIISLNTGRANIWSAAQTFPNSGIVLTGSSTGKTTFASANAGASNYTITYPAITGTLITTADSGTVSNTMLASPTITINSTSCTLGSTCTITTAATSVAIGTTTVSSGVTDGILYQTSGGKVGNSAAASSEGLIFNGNTSSSPVTPSLGTVVMNIVGANNGNPSVQVTSYGTGTPFMVLANAAGTGASPTAVQSSAELGEFDVAGYNGSAYALGGSWQCYATQNWTTSNEGTQCLFKVKANNANSFTTALTVDQDASLTVQGYLNVKGAYKTNGTSGTSCSAGTVSLTTLTVINGIVTAGC